MRVLLVCETGLGAQTLARHMEREIAAHGVPGTVDAFGAAQARGVASWYDVVLLAPQVAGAQNEFVEAIDGADTLVRVMSVADYGRRNAKKLANDVLLALGE